MADNMNVQTGSGGPVATDEIGGVQYQRVKVNYGADGSATDVSSTTPLPVYESAGSAIKSSSVTVGTSAAALPSSALSGRKSMIIQNLGAADIYIGASGVAVGDGFKVAAGASSPSFAFSSSVTVYGISGSAGNDVRVLEAS